MPDKWELLRSLPFPVVIGALGFKPQDYKTRKGATEWYGVCPIHNAKNNKTSFSYHQSGKFQCFSCSAKGSGVIDLVKLVRNTGFKEAVAFLEGLDVPQTPKSPAVVNSDACSEVVEPLKSDTWRKFAVPCPWLEQRVPDAGVRERYGVYCYDNPARRSAYSGRVMIPVKDEHGSLFGYLGRSISPSHNPDTKEESPKYLFPKNLPKSRFLFGSAELAAQFPLPVKVLYLLESPFAVMKFASLGVPAVSPFGWSVSTEQILLLHQLTRGVVYLPDKNKAEEAAHIVPTIGQQIWIRFPPLPDGLSDPEQLPSREDVLALTR